MKAKPFSLNIVFSLLAILSIANYSLQATEPKPEEAYKTDILPQQEGKLIFAIDVIRHGDRTPRSDFPTTPHSWPEGIGQLTPRGIRQEFELGKKFRDRYVNNYKLLPPHYAAGTMYVRSTGFDRTIVSAESLLLGLYPLGTGPRMTIAGTNEPALPEGFQPIPIYSFPVEQEKLLITDNELNNFDVLLFNNVYQMPEWKKMVADITPHLPAWSKATGIPLKNTYQLRPIADVLSMHEIYNMPLPPGLSKEDADKIIETADWEFTTAFKNKTIARATGLPFLQNIGSYLKQASEQKTPLKYVLFSGHDSSIMAAAGALGASLNKVPPYASDLNFSLFDQGNKNYRVVVTYNDQPMILPCTGTNSCSLEQFLKFVEYTPPTTPLSK